MWLVNIRDRCEITLILAQPRLYHQNPSSWKRHSLPSEYTKERNEQPVRRQGEELRQHGRPVEGQPSGTPGSSKLLEFLSKGMPLETMVRGLRSHPSEENVAKVHWLESLLEKEIDKESKSLEQLVTGFGRFAEDGRARDLRDWVSRVIRSGEKEYYKGAANKEALETADGQMTELGVAVLNSVLKQFLEHAYSLGNSTDESLPNTVNVPGYLVLDSDVHPGEKGAHHLRAPESMATNRAKSGRNLVQDRLPVASPKARHSAKCQDDIFHAKEEGREIPLLPWRNLIKTKTDAKEKLLSWKSQSKISHAEKSKPNHTQLFPKFNFRQKMSQAINSIRLMSDLKKTAVSNRVENSMGGVLHKYRSGESPPRNRLGRQWERIRRSDVSERDQEGIKLELKELLNTITNRSNGKLDEEEGSDDVTSLPRVAFALPKNLLMDSTTPGSQIKVSRYHCHKFVPSCAKYASMHRKHHVRKNPTSELVNFLLMLHRNDTKSVPKGAMTGPDSEYGCYDDDEAYDDEEEDDEEDDGVDFGNPFQELKLTTTTCSPLVGSVTPAPCMQLITCTTSSTKCETTGTTCPTPSTSTTTCQAPTTKKTDPTLNPGQLSSLPCKAYYQSILGTKDVTEKKNFFGELRLVTKVTQPSVSADKLDTKKNKQAARSGVEENGSTMKLCSCHLSRTTLESETKSSVTTASVNSTNACTQSVTATTCEIHGNPEAAATSSTTVQPSLKVQTYSCPPSTCEQVRTTLPPMPQHHEVLTMAPPPPPPSLPPCGVTGAVRNRNMDNHVHEKETRSTVNKKRVSSRRGGNRGRRRHKTKSDLPDTPYQRRRYQRRQKLKGRTTKTDEQTGLLAILADPSVTGAMKNGLWRYVPYRMVHLKDVEKPLEIKRGVVRDTDRLHHRREPPNFVRPIRKKTLQRLLLRDEPKYRRRYQETGRNHKDDNDYDYDDYESYADENYENGP